MNKIVRYESEVSFRLRLEARLKNASLVSARENLGLTVKDAAEKIGISYGVLIGIESMKYYPSSDMQTKICEFYREQGQFLYEEDAFPRQIKGLKLGKFVAEREIPQSKLVSLSEISENELPPIESSMDSVIEDNLIETQRDLVVYALDRLTPLQRAIVSQHMGLDGKSKSLEAITKERGVSLQSTKQTLDLAIRRLRRVVGAKYKFAKFDRGYVLSIRNAE